MQILFISRATLYEDPGGDTVQVNCTAKYLRRPGVTVDIRLCNEPIDYTGYDLIHFFNIIRPADILVHIKKSRLPFVISTIYVDYTEYEKKMRTGFGGLIFRTFSPDFIEYVKVLARFAFNGEKILSSEYLWLGHRKSVQKIIRRAEVLLPNSHNEYRRLETHYNMPHAYAVIPNAIDPVIFNTEENAKRDPSLIICAGRIEGRKNQLNLIRAINNTRYKLVIIGGASRNQRAYFDRCRSEAAQNITFTGNLAQADLADYYRRAKVHVLASWFETTGLSSLEASAQGCNIVVTDKGDTREYFENFAWYCDPGSTDSILRAVDDAARNEHNKELTNLIFSKYTWPIAADATLAAYRQVLDKR